MDFLILNKKKLQTSLLWAKNIPKLKFLTQSKTSGRFLTADPNQCSENCTVLFQLYRNLEISYQLCRKLNFFENPFQL